MKPLTDSQRDLVERIGVLHDRMGMRPAAGRILGLLIVAPDGELTFDEIRETLELSKSAISTTLQHLQDIGSVEYRTRPGKRKRYFRKVFQDWETGFIERGMRFLDIRFLLAEAARGRGDVDPETTRALESMVEFLDLLARTVQETHERWQASTDIEDAVEHQGHTNQSGRNP